MRISKKQISPQKEKELLQTFFQLIVDLKNPQEAERVFKGLLTETEIIMVAKRLAIAKGLSEGTSYNEIRKKFKVSSATISQISSLIGQTKGLPLALKKIEADQWADYWSKKIKNLFK